MGLLWRVTRRHVLAEEEEGLGRRGLREGLREGTGVGRG